MKKLLVLLLVMFSLVMVTAQGLPTQVNANTNVGYDIRFPEYTHARTNTTFELHTHVYNRSTGLLLDNSSVACFLHLYNPVGGHLLSQRMGYEKGITPMGEFNVTILGTNFSSFGMYAYVIQCNSTVFGGFASGEFEVTYSGSVIDTEESLLVITFVILFLSVIIMMLYFASKIPDANASDDLGQVTAINYVKYVRHVLYNVSYVLFTYWLFTIANVCYAYLPDTFLATTFFMLYRIMFTAMFIILPLYLVWLLVNLIKDKQLQKMLNQGFNP